MPSHVGIIVPVYNVEKYITECIDSILAQTYTNFRLILVDDGTPDNAGEICDDYAKKDTRITVIHQENAGVTRARARGVEEANDCKYIMFVDADDTIHKNALRHLLSHTNDEVDIVLAKMSRHSDEVKNKESEKKHNITQLTAEQHRVNMILGIDSGPTAKLFRRNLFTNEVFDLPRNIVMGEDTIANIRIAFNNKQNVITTTKCVYYYRQHDESIMHTFNGSAEYEDKFLQHLRSSIPKKEFYAYAKYIVIRKIRTYDYHFGYSAEVPGCRDSLFYHTLLKELKEYHIKELLIERLLITATNYSLRKILILLKRIKHKFFGQNTLL